MRLIFSYLAVIFSLGLLSCGESGPTKTDSQGNTSGDSVTPVETKRPNSNYSPAFSGQTRIGGVRTKSAYQVTVVSTELNKPWGIVLMPDGRFLITEKQGTMRIANSEGKLGAPVTGIPKVNAAGQGGLLGLALDPSFKENRMVYWAFSEATSGGNLTAVAKGRLAANEKTIENATVIYRAAPAYNGTLHYGGRVVFDKDGNLFLSTGERSDIQTRPQAQFLNSALGKVLRITKDGKPATGNPFLNRTDVIPELYSYGHRNVQGLTIHPVTGDLWENEFGPRGGDEINIIHPGKNYGWPIITYGIEYSGGTIGEGLTEKQGLEQPVYYWDPVLSPSGMVFYKGDEIDEWKNSLFICGLSSNHIARLVIVNNKVTGEERIAADQGQRFRDITNGNDGALYAVTDEGRLYRIGK